MELRELRVFLNVCQSGSFSSSARDLVTSQPAVSRTIRELEDEVGLILFRRNGRGVELTSAGSILRDHAEIMVREYERLEEAMQNLREDEVGEIRIAVPFYLGRILIPPTISSFRNSFPHAQLRMTEASAADIVKMLAEDRIEAGLYFNPPTQHSINADVVAIEPQFAIGPPHLMEASVEPITLGELACMPMIMPSSQAPQRTLVVKAFRACRLELNIALEIEFGAAQLSFVKAGHGVTVLPWSHYLAESDRSDLVIRPLATEISRKVILGSGPKRVDRLSRDTLDLFKRTITQHREVLRWLPPEISKIA